MAMGTATNVDGVLASRSAKRFWHAGHNGRAVLSGADWERIRGKLGLSLRESEVVQRIMWGYKLLAIANDMGLSLGTVKTYSQRVYRKLGISDQRELTFAVITAYLGSVDAALQPQRD